MAPAGGFTLLEVLVALTLLTGALLALAQLMLVAARASDASKATTLATALAAQRIEQLRALAWAMAPDGTAVEDVECEVARWPDAPTGGVGLTPSPADALLENTPGYVDYLDASGRWIGDGRSPPAFATYLQRWSIEAPEGSSPATLVLRVVVWRRGVPSRLQAESWLPIVQIDAAKTWRGE